MLAGRVAICTHDFVVSVARSTANPFSLFELSTHEICVSIEVVNDTVNPEGATGGARVAKVILPLSVKAFGEPSLNIKLSKLIFE